MQPAKKLTNCAAVLILAMSLCACAAQTPQLPEYKRPIPSQLKIKPKPISPLIEKTLLDLSAQEKS